MKFAIVIFIVGLFCFNTVNSQNSVTNPNKKSKEESAKKIKSEAGKTFLGIGGGAMGSVLYLARNIKEKNDAYGYSFCLNYGGTNLFRFSMQYTYYVPINISPTWYNINASTIEANLEIMARFSNNKSCLYPLAGISYNTFSGYFTGLNDFLNLRNIYQPNTTILNTWVGINLGSGFEHAFGPVVLFFDYRMRLGLMERTNYFNIMDVCYGGGIRIKLSVPTFKKIYVGLKDRYNVG